VSDPDWGFHGQLFGGFTGYLTFSQLSLACPRPPNTSGPVPPGTVLTNYVYHDSYGRSHRFNYALKSCPLSNPDITVTGNGSTVDGSGLSYGGPNLSSGQSDGLVHTKSGQIINAPVRASGTNSGSFTDSNGNVVTNKRQWNFHRYNRQHGADHCRIGYSHEPGDFYLSGHGTGK
jgi:hypothetical protein